MTYTWQKRRKPSAGVARAEAGAQIETETTQTTPAPPVVARVLAVGAFERGTLEAAQLHDGSLALLKDGKPVGSLHYHWPAGSVEPCINAFLRLLRHRPGS